MKRNFRQLSLWGTGAILALASQASMAAIPYTCSHPIYGTGVLNGDTQYTSANCVYGHTANKSSTLVTSPLVLQASASNTNNLVVGRLQNLRNSGANNVVASSSQPFGSGIASGDYYNGWNVWVNGVYNDVENTFAETAFDGHVATVMLGVDTMIPAWNMILGVAFGWEDQDIDTRFNGGKQDGDGWSITPYLNWMFHNNWSVSAYFGFVWMDYDLSRADPATGFVFNGSADADRYYGAIDLLYHNRWNNTRFDGQMGFFFAKETRDAYNETGPVKVTGQTALGTQTVSQAEVKTDLGQFRLGGTVGFTMDEMFEPYLRALFLWDFNQDDITVAPIQGKPQNDETGIVFGAGLNVNVVENVSLNFDAFTELTRDDYERWGIGASILIKFD